MPPLSPAIVHMEVVFGLEKCGIDIPRISVSSEDLNSRKEGKSIIQESDMDHRTIGGVHGMCAKILSDWLFDASQLPRR